MSTVRQKQQSKKKANMGKSNGSTRQSTSGNPRGLTAAQQNIIAVNNRAFSGPILGGDNTDKIREADLRAIQTKGFTDSGGGMWELNTPHADASILLSEEPGLGRVYEIQTVGAEDLRNGAYSTSSPRRTFSTLNAAKQATREELEKYYKSVNS